MNLKAQWSPDPAECEDWYFLTKVRLAKKGIDVGFEYDPSMENESHGVVRPFDFISHEHFLLELVRYAIMATEEDEMTEHLYDVVGEMWWSKFEGQALVDEITRLEVLTATQGINEIQRVH